MFEPFAPVIDAFAKRLATNYREVFGKAEPDHAHLLRAVAKLALERIADRGGAGVGGATLRARVRGGARAAPARDGAGRGRRRRRAAGDPGPRTG